MKGHHVKPSVEILFKPLTQTQADAKELWKRSRIQFMLGAAGTGKTLCSLALSLQDIFKMKRDGIDKPKLMLCRPTVTCGEELGYIPGDLDEKLAPWLAPFADVFSALSVQDWKTVLTTLDVEAVPIGMLRGRTIRNGVLIVDEGQNLTYEQLVCILTRLGSNSKIVICGDPHQSDLYKGNQSPLTYVSSRLSDMDTVSVVNFTTDDIVRDPLITQIVNRLEVY